MKRFAIQKRSLILLLLEDIVDWALFTVSKTCFIKANLGETLSSRTPILFSSNLPVTWCKSARLVHCWVSDQGYLVGIETQHRYPTVICSVSVAPNRRSVKLLHKHRIHSLKVLYPVPAGTIKTFGRWTHKVSLLSKCPNHFPTNAKSFSFSLTQKSLSGSSANV